MNTESLKRVLTKMKAFARGERLKKLDGRVNPTNPKTAAKQEKLSDDPNMPAGLDTVAEEGAESPEERLSEGEPNEVKPVLKVEIEAEGPEGSEGSEGSGENIGTTEDEEIAMARHLLTQMK